VAGAVFLQVAIRRAAHTHDLVFFQKADEYVRCSDLSEHAWLIVFQPGAVRRNLRLPIVSRIEKDRVHGFDVLGEATARPEAVSLRRDTKTYQILRSNNPGKASRKQQL
jgi:hypothetical protein